MPACAVEIKNLSKKMGDTLALSGISLTMEPGIIHGIIGPNGAGKTTLMRLMAGLLRAGGGSITYTLDGKTLPPAQAKIITGYFPQEPSLYPDLSCQEHLEFFRDLYDINQKDFEQRSRELLHATGMADFTARPAGKLSGGMYKKLGIMCVLLNRPKLLLLDEPTIGVDPLSRRQLWDMIYHFAGNDITVILNTSYMDEARRCAKVHVLDAGKVLASGAPADLTAKFNVKNFAEIFLKNE